MRLIDRLRIYAEEYRKPPLGREIEGTAELLEETAEYIEELSNGTNDGSKSEFFEKVLKEKLSPETFALISADEQVFGKWIERLNNVAKGYGELAVQLKKDVNFMEFVEKLIEKLDEEKGKHFDREKPMDIDRIGVFAFDKAIDVVRGFATDTNDDYSGWIPCSSGRLPEERESIFAKYKGTDKWNDAMFEKISDVVNVTVTDEEGRGDNHLCTYNRW